MKTTRSARRPAVPNTDLPTVIEFIIDESGSMQSCVDATISGFTSFLDEQKSAAGRALLSLTKFEGGNLVTPYVDLDVNLALPLTRETFLPAGGTNLRDALGSRVRDLENRLKSWATQPQVLVVVLTDGMDNQSPVYSTAQIRDTICAHESRGWTFVYLGSDARALVAAADMGFQPGNSKKFEVNAMHQTMETLSRATTAYRATATGTSKSFFA